MVRYRIIDQTLATRANNLTLAQAQECYQVLVLDYPLDCFEIESYNYEQTRTTAKPT